MIGVWGEPEVVFRGRASDTGFVGEVPPKGEYFCIPDNQSRRTNVLNVGKSHVCVLPSVLDTDVSRAAR